MKCTGPYTGICTGEAKPGRTMCQACTTEQIRRSRIERDLTGNWDHRSAPHLSCAVPLCNAPREKNVSYCFEHDHMFGKGFRIAEIRTMNRHDIANTILPVWNRRSIYTHPGIVYVFAFHRAGVIKVGATVARALKDRREYARRYVFEHTGKNEYPSTEHLITNVPEPANLERFICSRLGRPKFRHEFFPIGVLPAIQGLLDERRLIR